MNAYAETIISAFPFIFNELSLDIQAGDALISPGTLL